MGSIALNIEYITNLLHTLRPEYLEIIDESHKHKSHYAIESGVASHIKVVIIAENFKGLTTLKRHRLINDLLKPAFDLGLHAVGIKAYVSEEFQVIEKEEDKGKRFIVH